MKTENRTEEQQAAPAAWDEQFEAVLRRSLRLLADQDPLPADMSLSAAGLDSMTTIDMMMTLEDTYGVTFPDAALTARTFATPLSLWEVLSTLRAGADIPSGRPATGPTA